MKTIKRGSGLFPKEVVCYKCKSILLVDRVDLYKGFDYGYGEMEPNWYVRYVCCECGHENSIDYTGIDISEIRTLKKKIKDEHTCTFRNGMHARCTNPVVEGTRRCCKHSRRNV